MSQKFVKFPDMWRVRLAEIQADGSVYRVALCAPVHDAVLICAPLNQIEDNVAAMRAAMAEASRFVLDGFELRTDVKVVRWPHRYMDPRGRQMWDQITSARSLSTIRA
jgi:hypothetical protein